MSVFPRYITKGDNVVIHVKMMNFSSICLPVFLDTYIQNKRYKKWIVRDKLFILPPGRNGKSSDIERYFIVATNGRGMPLGKYDCFSSIRYLGKKAVSLTRKDDYFIIEDVAISRKAGFIVLENKSSIPAAVEIFSRKGKKKSKKIGSFKKIYIPDSQFLYAICAGKVLT